MSTRGIAGRSARRLRRIEADDRGATSTWVFSVASLAVVFSVGAWLYPVPSLLVPSIPWWALAIAFYAAEWLIVRLRFGRDVYSVSMSAGPLVVGLFAVSPFELFGAVMVAAILFSWHSRHLPVDSMVFTIGQRLLQTAAALAVFHLAAPSTDLFGPAAWLVAISAVLVALVLRHGEDYVMARLSGANPAPRDTFEAFAFSSTMAVLNAALGMLVVRALFVAPRSALFAVIPALVLFGIFRIYASSRNERARLEALYQATRDLHAAPQVESSLQAAATHARDMFEAEFCEIVLLLGDEAEAYRTIVGPGDHQSAMEATDLNRWHLVWKQAYSAQRPFLVDRSGSLASSAGEQRLPINSAMIAPILISDELAGIMVVANHVDGTSAFGDADLEMLATLTGHVGTAVENGRLEDSLAQLTELKEELRHQALHDGLTGLANRTLFRERIAHAMQLTRRNGGQAGVLFLDLDDFKHVNDSHGHAAGDELLDAVSAKLLSHCRPEDTVARLGGDEFGVLLEGVEDPQEAITVAERILEGLASPIVVAGREVFANASIGIAFGEYGDMANQVLRDADAAMYAAKKNGKATFALFETSMHAEVLAQIQMKADLDAAIAKQELRLLYQPLVDLETGEIKGYEALVRWQHSRKGWVGPDTFIPFAEQTGLIHAIGRWVLWEALSRLRAWQEVIGPGETDFEVTVNLSAKQLEDPMIVSEVARALDELGTDPSLLVLEITETAMMKSAPERLEELRNLGVRLAIDDFGTGYSSLASLHKLPVDVLKIDRLFVEGLEDGASPFVATIVGLGQALGLDLIVEGIETKEQLERVQALGCQLGQGFYFAKPLEAKQAGALLERQVKGESVFNFRDLAEGFRDRRLRAVR